VDITQLILTDHAEFRRLFLAIDDIARDDIAALGAVWTRLRDLLDVHAEAEERFFYPKLLKVGEGGGDADSAAEETEDAIKDHNEIRDTAKQVDQHPVGSEPWFAAIDACNEANSDHMAEEERQGLADFRRTASLEVRHALAVKFLAFEAGHRTGIEPVDKDPKEYVSEHE
jgi:hypothetical protein